MKQNVVQLLVGLLGLFVLAWGEAKHYIESHPEVINSFQLEAKRAEPLVYYQYQIAYDPNSGKTWYYYGDGFWYDRPPEIRQKKKSQEISTGGNRSGQVGRQKAEASAFTGGY